jgi:hypothetical protein
MFMKASLELFCFRMRMSRDACFRPGAICGGRPGMSENWVGQGTDARHVGGRRLNMQNFVLDAPRA